MKTAKVILLAIIAFLVPESVHSQGRLSNATPVFPWGFTKIGAKAWAAGGAYIAEKDNPTAAFTNPAALDAQRTTLYVEVGKRNRVGYPLVSDISWNGQFVLPSYVALSKPLGNTSIAIGYATWYSLLEKLGPLPITTVEQPEGTGEFLDGEGKLDVHSFFGSANHPVNDELTLGLTLGLTWLRRRERIWRDAWSGNGFGAQLIIGGLFTLSRQVTAAGVVRYIGKIDYDMRPEKARPVVVYIDIPEREPLVIEEEAFPVYAKFPWSFELGMSYQSMRKLKLMAKLDFQQWSRKEGYDEDEVQMHVGAKAILSEALHLDLGFFTQYYPVDGMGKYFDQKFLTAGFTWRVWGRYAFSCSVLDSHLFGQRRYSSSKEGFHQTELVSGIAVSF